MSIHGANLRQIVASGTDPVKIRRAFLLVVDVINDLQRKIDALTPEGVTHVQVTNDDGNHIFNSEHAVIWTEVA